jgi:hypothetical protein
VSSAWVSRTRVMASGDLPGDQVELPAEFFRRCLADARGGPGNQGTETLEVSLVVHLSSFRLRDLSCRE